MRYSGLKVITQGLFGNKGWTPAWRDPAPKDAYDAIIIGGGGHGLATAFYLAKNHGMTNISGATPPSCAPTISCPAIPNSIPIR
jgi:methylglutamate dehydrogenase subunit A